MTREKLTSLLLSNLHPFKKHQPRIGIKCEALLGSVNWPLLARTCSHLSSRSAMLSLHQDPDVLAARKSRLCNKLNAPGGCPYGDRCNFAHGKPKLKRALIFAYCVIRRRRSFCASFTPLMVTPTHCLALGNIYMLGTYTYTYVYIYM
jgi:hypothetical protein